MQGYENKAALKNEIEKTANLFVNEFGGIIESEKDLIIEGVDRSPAQMLAYQLGWMELIRGWDENELAGKEAVTPAPGVKWNQMGVLYQGFYNKYSADSIESLQQQFREGVENLLTWLDQFSEAELFEPGGRAWAASTSSNWPVWKWVHINTVAPFKSFRSKIRKWKKQKTV